MNKPIKIALLSLLNAGIMLTLTFYWLSLPYTFGDEAFLIKWSSLVKKSLLGFDEKPNPEQVLFVDVSESKTTIRGTNEAGDPSPYHTEVITDRRQLTEFLGMINDLGGEARFVLLDILFEDTTRFDDSLQMQMTQLGEKLLSVSHLAKSGEHIRPVFEIPYAPATYAASQGLFLKFPLVLADSLKTAPLVLYEKLHHARFDNKGLFYTLNGKISLTSPIVDFKIRPADFRTGTSLGDKNFALHKMGTILESRNYMNEADQRAWFRNRLVLVGDFSTDMHMTPFGKTPGLLLIYNAYLTLAKKQNTVSLAWVIFLLSAFAFVSYRIFTDTKVTKPRWLIKVFESKTGHLILNSLDEITLLAIITFLSYFIFNIHVNILALFLYLKIMEFLWKKARSLGWKAKLEGVRAASDHSVDAEDRIKK